MAHAGTYRQGDIILAASLAVLSASILVLLLMSGRCNTGQQVVASVPQAQQAAIPTRAAQAPPANTVAPPAFIAPPVTSTPFGLPPASAGGSISSAAQPTAGVEEPTPGLGDAGPGERIENPLDNIGAPSGEGSSGGETTPLDDIFEETPPPADEPTAVPTGVAPNGSAPSGSGTGTLAAPASIDSVLAASLAIPGEAAIELQIQPLEAARGLVADQILGGSFTALNPAPSGEEYVVVRFGIEFLDWPGFGVLEITPASFLLETTQGSRDALDVGLPQPSLPITIYSGNATDAWVLFTTPAGDPNPSLGFVSGLLNFDTVSAVGGGAWWSLIGAEQ